MPGSADDLRSLIEASVLLLTLGPGSMAFFSGLIGSASYWTSNELPPGAKAESLAQGLNAGLVVGFIVGFPAGFLAAAARIANII